MALPIESVLPDLKKALAHGTGAVLTAAPGAGKTTMVPLALLDEPWLQGRRIIMLEPRRLASRAAARYMAAMLGEHVGETVGYRTRLDTRVSAKTRIEVATEGVLTRLLHADPALEDTGLVIFDEFHERSLHADLGLALCLQSREILREDLRILIMSATLEAEKAAELLGSSPIIRCTGHVYPVETRYLGRSKESGMERMVAETIREAFLNEEGDILAFLPGEGEIRRTEAMLSGAGLPPAAEIIPLYGNLPLSVQDRALAPSPAGHRKIVLATSIAETSLTVEGIRIVVDSGLMRVPRFSPRTGMTRLETVKVSRSSADQRRGRAGRLGPGVCYRLWTAEEDKLLEPHRTPEILEADLAPLMLELAVWGVTDPSELRWLDPPPRAACRQARELLGRLGALDKNGHATPYGRKLADFGLHPRLAHMILKAVPLGLGGLACELAAVLNERDFFRGGTRTPDADLRLRVEALHVADGTGRAFESVTDMSAVRRILAEAKYLKKKLGLSDRGNHDGRAHGTGLLLSFAYPDRIAQGRGNGRFLLQNGRGAALAANQPLAGEAYLVAADVADNGTESRIYLAAPIGKESLERYFAHEMEEESVIFWDREAQAVRARLRKRLGAIVLDEIPHPDPDPEHLLRALLQGIRVEGLAVLPWTKTAVQLRQRLVFMHRIDRRWPDVSDESLLSRLEDWLAPHLYALRSRDDLQHLQLAAILLEQLTREQRRELDEWAPTHITVPSGSRIPVDYSDPASPVLAVRLQEMFGLAETPRIARGQVPLTLHLLSPAMRPVQVTQDLASFWREAYFEVRKDLKGRYPKHHWPDDPWNAVPTRRVRPGS